MGKGKVKCLLWECYGKCIKPRNIVSRATLVLVVDVSNVRIVWTTAAAAVTEMLGRGLNYSCVILYTLNCFFLAKYFSQ